MLCAAMNPCPCGYYPDLNRCTCTSGEISHYMGKISRPLLDRIDISTEVPPVSFAQLHCGKKGETSAIIRKRVEKVQKIQEERYKDEKISFNGQLRSSLIDKYCLLRTVHQSCLRERLRELHSVPDPITEFESSQNDCPIMEGRRNHCQPSYRRGTFLQSI